MTEAVDVLGIALLTAALVLLALYVLVRFYVIPRGRALLLDAVMPGMSQGPGGGPPPATSSTSTELQDLLEDADSTTTPHAEVGTGDVQDMTAGDEDATPPGVTYERSDG